MLKEFSPGKVYIACGYTDLRRGIDGLASIVEKQFSRSFEQFCLNKQKLAIKIHLNEKKSNYNVD